MSHQPGRAPITQPSLSENKINCAQKAERGPEVVELQGLLHVEKREGHEDRHGDDFLDDLELGQGEGTAADPIGGHLQQVLKKGDAPTDERGNEPRLSTQITQMRLPREGHENIRAGQQADRFPSIKGHAPCCWNVRECQPPGGPPDAQ